MLQIETFEITDPHTQACAIALYYLSHYTDCPNTRLFSKLFADDLIATNVSFDELLKSPCGNRLSLIQYAIEYITDKDDCMFDKNDMEYVNNKICNELNDDIGVINN
jgi:hypothetical protein